MTNNKPIVPNYVSGVGRLATGRYTFEQHVEGTAFNHNADNIFLSPLITINGNQYNNVQSAIGTLSQNLIPPTISNATTTTVGLIQLSGDISGTATNVKVTGLRGFPIQNLTPTTGQILQYGGSSWAPAALPAAIPGWTAPVAASVRLITTTYVVDSISSDLFLLVSPATSISITLPVPTLGRVLIIKATSAIGTSNNTITVLPHASEMIDGDSSSYAYTVNYGTLRLVSDSSNWWVW